MDKQDWRRLFTPASLIHVGFQQRPNHVSIMEHVWNKGQKSVHLCSLMGSIEQTNCSEEATIKGIIIGLRFGFLSMLIAEQGALHAVVLHFFGEELVAVLFSNTCTCDMLIWAFTWAFIGGEGGGIKLMLNRLEQGATRRGWGVLNMFTEWGEELWKGGLCNDGWRFYCHVYLHACARSLSSPKTCESSLSPPPSSSFVNSTMSIFCIRISWWGSS